MRYIYSVKFYDGTSTMVSARSALSATVRAGDRTGKQVIRTVRNCG